MVRTSLITLLVLLMSTVALAGDPLDANDGPSLQDESSWIQDNDNFSETGCRDSVRWPACVPCWSRCLFAIMADIAFDGDWDGDW